VLAGLQTGRTFSYAGKHFTIGPVQFSPRPVQRPRIPIWVGGHLPGGGPLTRAARAHAARLAGGHRGPAPGG